MPSPSPAPVPMPTMGWFPDLLASRDLFGWLADFWVPAMGIVVTLGVSVVALIVSNRAQTLAGQLEAERDADQRRRYDEDRRMRLRELAINEARALHRWLAELDQRRGFFRIGRPVGEAVPPREPHVQAQVDAEVMLQQSIVPGAQELYELTSFDVMHRWSLVPDTDDDKLNDIRQEIIRARRERTRNRIREWALDPEAEVESLGRELGLIDDDPTEYLLVGHELTWPAETADD